MYTVGKYVLLSMCNLPLCLPGSTKLKPLWVGPYQILETVGANAVKLALPPALASLHPVFNIALVKCYVGTVIPAPDPVKLDAGPEYEVQAILRHRSVGRGPPVGMSILFLLLAMMRPTMSGCPLQTWQMPRTFSGHTRRLMVLLEDLPVWGEWCSACACFAIALLTNVQHTRRDSRRLHVCVLRLLMGSPMVPHT